MRARSAIVRLGLGVVIACGRGRDAAVAAADSAAGRAAVTVSVPVAQAPWRVVTWEPYAGVEPGDLGVGVAFLHRAEDKGAAGGTDTLMLRSAPNAGAAAVGVMLYTVSPANGVASYAIVAPDSLRPNLVEYGYEESGVPFDSADATARWVRGILGFTRDGTALTGWIDTSQRGVGVVRWAAHLADRPIYFPQPERAAFFASPDSSKPLSVPVGDDDAYAIHPIAARGAWLEVRLVEPSDNCEPDTKPSRTRTVWIRYLDDRGRPNVWYYPRGC